MDWHLAIGGGAGLIAIVATIPYLRDVLRGKARPNTVSWTIWTAVVLITAIAQISAGASWSFFLLVGSTIANVAVLSLCIFGYGYKKFEVTDRICLSLACAALFFWWITSNPVVAILFAVAADGIAYVPTYVKIYREPKSDSYFYWATLVVADVMALVSVTTFNMANILFPISYGLFNGMILVAAFFGKKLNKI